jgi:hypothetical protein
MAARISDRYSLTGLPIGTTSSPRLPRQQGRLRALRNLYRVDRNAFERMVQRGEVDLPTVLQVTEQDDLLSVLAGAVGRTPQRIRPEKSSSISVGTNRPRRRLFDNVGILDTLSGRIGIGLI